MVQIEYEHRTLNQKLETLIIKFCYKSEIKQLFFLRLALIKIHCKIRLYKNVKKQRGQQSYNKKLKVINIIYINSFIDIVFTLPNKEHSRINLVSSISQSVIRPIKTLS